MINEIIKLLETVEGIEMLEFSNTAKNDRYFCCKISKDDLRYLHHLGLLDDFVFDLNKAIKPVKEKWTNCIKKEAFDKLKKSQEQVND